MTNNTLDAGIPVLTEIIPAPQPDSEAEQKEIVSPEAHAVAVSDEEQWDRLECEIRERVLHQVLERIDFVLEQRVRDSLADVLQTAVEDLASDIKSGLHYSIKDVVTRAITDEITKLQAAKK